jgi:hypothetical protein
MLKKRILKKILKSVDLGICSGIILPVFKNEINENETRRTKKSGRSEEILTQKTLSLKCTEILNLHLPF